MSSFEKEIQTYCQLKELQGICIPRLLPYLFNSYSGNMVGFAMDKVTPLPDEFSAWSVCQKQEAFDCLMRLAEDGHLCHNDIRGSNFGIWSDKTVVFDLEDVKECRSKDVRCYKAKLIRTLLL